MNYIYKGKFKPSKELQKLGKKDQKDIKEKIKTIKYIIVFDDDSDEIPVTANYKAVSYKKYAYWKFNQFVEINWDKQRVSKKMEKAVDYLSKKY